MKFSWFVFRPGRFGGGWTGGWTMPLTGSSRGSSRAGGSPPLLKPDFTSIFLVDSIVRVLNSTQIAAQHFHTPRFIADVSRINVYNLTRELETLFMQNDGVDSNYYLKTALQHAT
uniref:Uncharacterized protein n=1 Tax=Cacopsylla melanoneura TaxID=428564 RepID=A0A8D8XNY9_9HEMI